ncbi:transcription factor bHLH120-like [Macadamia integrifolia]|uniref:transcription factor bHLH120-like n=1 Tax=Macadamia integrifolia TaxID=60698 RepID=UPI001C4EF164|nr:transcription factor bHLH120-like [Macadamia integrifolia]
MDERSQGMDFIPPDLPIFPLQQTHELFFQASSTSGQQQPDPQQHTLPFPPSLDFTDLPLKLDISKGGRRKPFATPNSSVETSNEKKKKKIVHRDVERQRRQEMASLYASLRSQLPIEYIKGKRSISDHMNEATKYIGDLGKRIQELSEKRERLKKMPNSGPPDAVSDNCLPVDTITVQPCWGGVEVVISSGLRNEEFPLSRVMRVLVDQGFSIISCVSTTVNERSLHTIQSEVSDIRTVDLSGLQQKLNDFIASSSS